MTEVNPLDRSVFAIYLSKLLLQVTRKACYLAQPKLRLENDSGAGE